MAKSLNFNNLKKQYLSVTLADEKNTTLLIGTPTKKLMDDLTLLQSNLEAIEEDSGNTESFDELYTVCAKIMSRNKAGVIITKEKLEDIFDFEDVVIFFNAYMEFISEVTGSKN
jgi:hypothetical protein